MHITKVGNQFAVWAGYKLVGVYESALEAQDAVTGWDRILWPWESLYDVEHAGMVQESYYHEEF